MPPMVRREKPVIVLEALMIGMTVGIDGENFVMSDDFGVYSKKESLSSDGKIVMKRTLSSVPDFIKLCNLLSEEEIAVVCGGIALNKTRHTKR